MHVIYKMIEATGGEQDAQKAVDAVKGLAWESPRGPVQIDAESRHITQNIYLREVAKAADGTYYNKEIATFEKQPDPGLAARASKRRSSQAIQCSGEPIGFSTMQTVLSIAVDAIAYGMVLFVISIGLSVTMGLMRVVNLAHGAFAMIGGYIASYVAKDLGFGYGVAILAAVVGAIVIAIPIERFLYRRIYGAPELTQVLMTIGITFCVIGIANYAFGPTLKTIPLPETLRGPVDLGFRSIAAHKLFAIACGVVVALGLWMLIERTPFGVKLRASVDNAAMAASLGVRTKIVYAVSFARRGRPRRFRRHRRRGAAAHRALLRAALHGDVPGRGVGRRRGLHPRRAARLPGARRHRHDRPISAAGISASSSSIWPSLPSSACSRAACLEGRK